MTALPYQGQLKVPIEWTGAVAKQTMKTGALNLSGTIGFRPWSETATLQWILPVAQGLALLSLLKTGRFNQVYEYTCTTRGAVKLRPLETYSFQERRASQQIVVTVAFETV